MFDKFFFEFMVVVFKGNAGPELTFITDASNISLYNYNI